MMIVAGVWSFSILPDSNCPLTDVNPHLDILRIMLKFADEMAKQCTDMDDALRLINQRLRKLEKSDSEKTEEIGRLNRIINRKDKEIHSLKAELATTKKELSAAKSRSRNLRVEMEMTERRADPESRRRTAAIAAYPRPGKA